VQRFSLAGWTMFVFGLLTIATGICGIAAPGLILRLLGLMEAGQQHYFVLPTSVAACSMGVYYVLAAASRWERFFAWTVPMRVFNATVFATFALCGQFPHTFILIGAWELSGAAATAIALFLDRRRKDPSEAL
jgi:hypothetical protein